MQAIVVFDPKSSFNQIKVSGTITFYQPSAQHRTLVTFDLAGLPPGTTRGVHIHRLGDLTKGCTSLCEHWSPNPKQLHGSAHLSGGRHVGDLCNNITADSQGKVNFSYEDELVDLFPPHSILGRSVVIHAQPDDLGAFKNQTNPDGTLTEKAKLSRTTGDAGARVACAVIGVTDPGNHPACIH